MAQYTIENHISKSLRYNQTLVILETKVFCIDVERKKKSKNKKKRIVFGAGNKNRRCDCAGAGRSKTDPTSMKLLRCKIVTDRTPMMRKRFSLHEGGSVRHDHFKNKPALFVHDTHLLKTSN